MRRSSKRALLLAVVGLVAGGLAGCETQTASEQDEIDEPLVRATAVEPAPVQLQHRTVIVEPAPAEPQFRTVIVEPVPAQRQARTIEQPEPTDIWIESD